MRYAGRGLAMPDPGNGCVMLRIAGSWQLRQALRWLSACRCTKEETRGGMTTYEASHH
jgi:hypothetical protein